MSVCSREKGCIAAIPMKRFEDSDTRFFDDKRRGEIIEK
jgi:hypothetical protein